MWFKIKFGFYINSEAHKFAILILNYIFLIDHNIFLNRKQRKFAQFFLSKSEK